VRATSKLNKISSGLIITIVFGVAIFGANSARAVTTYLEITPVEDFESSGDIGGPFAPASKEYQLKNTDVDSLFWGVDVTVAWLDIDPEQGWGELDPNESVIVTMSLNSVADTLGGGDHTDTITFTDMTNDEEDTRGVTLTVTAPPGELEVTPVGDFESSGEPGGPFSPSSKDYLLKNKGGQSLDWVASKTVDWLDLGPETWGGLDPCESTVVTVSLNSNADLLEEGVHTDTVKFTDITNEPNYTRGVTLSIVHIGGLWIDPESFDVEVTEGTTSEEILTVGNDGAEDIHFNLRTRETGREVLSGPLCLTSSAGAVGVFEGSDKIVLEYAFSEPVITSGADADYDMVTMAGLESYERTGAPIVPVRPVTVLIPYGKEVTSANVISLDTRQLAGTYQLQPGQKPYPLSYQGTLEPTEPDVAIYGQSAPWPGVEYEEVATYSKRGYQLLSINLFPLQYRPATGEITYATRVQLEVELADSTPAGIVRSSAAIKARLGKIADNPGALRSYPAEDMSVAKLGEPSALPGGGPYAYVIITNESLEGAGGAWNFHTLRDAKMSSGVSATIVTTEWIYANYDGTRPGGGSDNQTRIRNFLIDAYQTWGTEYVLLGGTISIVPARMFKVDGETMPVDMYYGCVDPQECTFDYDADGTYGERTDGVGGGDVDLYAEIYVGRATVANAVELENFIKKTLNYATTTSEYLSLITMLGEHLGFGGVSEYAKNSMEQIRLGGSFDGYFTYGFENHEQTNFYDFDTSVNLYDKDGTWSKSALINLMNNGKHLFNHLGHANYTYDMKLTTSDLSSLTNTDYFFAYSQGCNPGGFDVTNCFAEVITSMQHGAFAAVMNARSGWGRHNSTDGPSQRFARQFWDAALDEDMLEMGRANQDSKEDNLWDINGEYIRWCYYELNLFGDPQQVLRFEEACEWLTLELEAGMVGPGDTNDISVTFDAMTLLPGVYEAEIVVTSDDSVRPTIIVPVTMTVVADALQATPAGDFESSGTKGGPFSPAYKGYMLTNEGTEAVSWSTSETPVWLNVNPADGVLDPNELVVVSVCIDPNANLLEPGLYTETLIFLNEDSGSIKTRLVSLTVLPPDIFTESFDENDNDLADTMLTFRPDSSVAYYAACEEPEQAIWFPTDPNDGTYVALGDDDFAEVILDGGAQVSFYGQSYDRLYIGSNGYITFGAGDTEWLETLDNHFSLPRISALFVDLTPADVESISYKQLADSIVVTFEDVPLYGDKDAVNSFQVRLFFVDETIWITYLDLAAGGGIAGLSEGTGVPSFYMESDLSEYINCCRCGDFDGDSDVDLSDFVYVFANWLRDDCAGFDWCERTDIDRSGDVGVDDVGLAAYNWLTGTGIEYGWSEPYFHGELDHPDELWSASTPALSNGGLIIYYMNDNSEYMTHTLIEAHRDSPDGPFEPYRIISELSDGHAMGGPWASEDGLRLYYYEWGSGECYIKTAERSSTEDTWTYVKTFDEIHTNGISDSQPTLTADGLTMFYVRVISGDKYIWKATRPSIEEPFSETAEVSELNDPGHTVTHPSISPDGLTIYFESLRDHPKESIYKATRSDPNEPFGNIQLMEFSDPDLEQSRCYVNADGIAVYYYNARPGGPNGVYVTRWGPLPEYEWAEPYYHEEMLSWWGDDISGTDPFLSDDGLTLYFARHRWLEGTYDLAEAYRDTPEGPFTSKRVISELYTGHIQICPWVSSDQLRLYYCEWSDGECCIKMAERFSVGDTWTYVKTFDEIHTEGIADSDPTLTPDELTMFWNKRGGAGNKHIYVATRASIDDPFTDITELTELYEATDGMVQGPSILPDTLTIYFSSNHETAEECIYRATRTSIAEPFGDVELLEFCVPDKRESSPYVTPDEKTVYYRGNTTGLWGIYVTHKITFEAGSCLPR